MESFGIRYPRKIWFPQIMLYDCLIKINALDRRDNLRPVGVTLEMLIPLGLFNTLLALDCIVLKPV